MSKIKIVQIAYMGDDSATEYLDDKGRVWWQRYIVQTDDKPAHYNWEQIIFPEEPEAV